MCIDIKGGEEVLHTYILIMDIQKKRNQKIETIFFYYYLFFYCLFNLLRNYIEIEKKIAKSVGFLFCLCGK